MNYSTWYSLSILTEVEPLKTKVPTRGYCLGVYVRFLVHGVQFDAIGCKVLFEFEFMLLDMSSAFGEIFSLRVRKASLGSG